MEDCKTITELKKEFNKIKSVVTDDTRFIAEATLFMARKLDNIERLLSKKKRQPTEYQLKVGQYMKEGKPMQEAHELARKSKN
jgi:hypothetical protein